MADTNSPRKSLGERATDMLAEAAFGRVAYHFTNQEVAAFRGDGWGAIYVAPTERAAEARGLKEMRGDRHYSAFGPRTVDQVEGAVLYEVGIGALRIYTEDAPEEITEEEYNLRVSEISAVSHDKEAVRLHARTLLRRYLISRPSRQEQGSMIRFTAPAPPLSHHEMDDPAMHEALRLLGYDGSRVAEGATRPTSAYSIAILRDTAAQVPLRVHTRYAQQHETATPERRSVRI